MDDADVISKGLIGYKEFFLPLYPYEWLPLYTLHRHFGVQSTNLTKLSNHQLNVSEKNK